MFYNQEHLSKLLDQSQELMFIVDDALKVNYVNNCFCETLGYAHHEVINKPIQQFFPEKKYFQQFITNTQQQSWQEKVHCATKTNKTLALDLILSPMLNDKQEVIGILGKGSNLVSKNYLQQKIDHVTFTDSVTGFGNHQLMFKKLDAFFEKLQDVSEHASQPKLMCVGIDFENLQAIGDLHDYTLTHEILRTTTQIITDSINTDRGDIVSRISGCELVILYHFEDEIEAHAWLNAILKRFDNPIMLNDGSTVPVSLNAGVAILPKDADDTLSALKYVELAYLEASRLTNENCVFYQPELSTSFLYKLAIEKELRDALVNDEFELFYQPKLQLPKREIYGFEALVRWHNPERGFLTPFDFLQVAEDTKLIIEIGTWVLTKACKQQALWAKNGFNYKISINVSITQMKIDNFVDVVADTLKKTGANPAFIELELTESVFVENFHIMNDILKKLKVLGVSVSLDDFGTGYSSLSYLEQIPVDSLKIDKSFIKSMLDNKRVAAITKSIFDLSKELSIQVIAEGTEQKEQVDFLELMDCRCVQGYYFYHPMSVRDVDKLIGYA